MSEEISLIYMNLSQLLDEICMFLRDGVNKEVFTEESQRQAEMLIKRSKIQLQQISNITNGECYMQMEEQKKTEDDTVEEEEDLIYMDAEEEEKIPVEINDVCPFAGLPARDLPLDDKAGYIYMKTKFIFGFEKLKRIYAAIHEDWFLVYCNDKDSKPCNTYCLRTHRAQMILTTKQGENETMLFALINQETKQKWQFLAQTHKDMLQWITKINRFDQKNERQQIRNEPSSKTETLKEPGIVMEEYSEDEDGEHYDSVIIRAETENETDVKEPDDEEIYEVIRPQTPDKNENIPIPKPSEVSTLSSRRQQTPLPPLPTPDKKESSESLASYDNPVILDHWEKRSGISETPSFSEDEEQEIYDVLVTTTATKDQKEVKMSPDSPEEDAKEETESPLISSLKEKLLQSSYVKEKKERPLPPKKLTTVSPIKVNQQLNSPPRNSFNYSSTSYSPNLPNSKSSVPKPNLQPKPSFLAKPKIDVKIIRPSSHTKSSTKQVMKLAKEISMK